MHADGCGQNREILDRAIEKMVLKIASHLGLIMKQVVMFFR